MHVFELVNEATKARGQGSRQESERPGFTHGADSVCEDGAHLDEDRRTGRCTEHLRLQHVRSIRLLGPADAEQAHPSDCVHTCGLNKRYHLGEGAAGETVDPCVVSSMRAMTTRTVGVAAVSCASWLWGKLRARKIRLMTLNMDFPNPRGTTQTFS